MRRDQYRGQRGFVAFLETFSTAAVVGNISSALFVWGQGIRSLWEASGASSIGIAFLYTIPFFLNLPLLLQSFADMQVYRRFLIGLNVFILASIGFWVIGKLKELHASAGLCTGSFGECAINPILDPIFLAIIGVVVLTCLINCVVLVGNTRFTNLFFQSAVPAFVLAITAVAAYSLNLFCLPSSISPILHCQASSFYESNSDVRVDRGTGPARPPDPRF